MTPEEKREQSRKRLDRWRERNKPQMGKLKTASVSETGFAGCKDCRTCAKHDCRHNHNVALERFKKK